jgi:hypothetical protein
LKINGYVEKIQRFAVAFPKWLVYKKSNGNAPPLIGDKTMNKMPRFNAKPFYSANMRYPAGKGSWTFSFKGQSFTSSFTNYTDAKRDAASFFARTMGAGFDDCVEVCP